MLRVFSWVMFAVLVLNASVIPAAYACDLKLTVMPHTHDAGTAADTHHDAMAAHEKNEQADCCDKGLCIVCVKTVLYPPPHAQSGVPHAYIHEQAAYQLPQVMWLTLPPIRPPRMA